jgi:hypothetical protein
MMFIQIGANALVFKYVTWQTQTVMLAGWMLLHSIVSSIFHQAGMINDTLKAEGGMNSFTVSAAAKKLMYMDLRP